MGPDIVDEALCGIIPRACRFIFEHIAKNPEHCEFKVTCSFLEIYKEVIKDLLNPKGVNLKVRETPTRGVWVESLSETEVRSHLEVLRLLHQGEEHRAVASTNMNAVSSRSHSLFILTVTQKTRDGAIKIGKLNLADLAGSEKVGKTGASGETLEEAKKINQSLSALGNCIMALTKQKKQHVPYRDSKLTFILRESLGGNTKTTLLIACSPHSFNLEETVSTLRFGQRAKAIKNKVKINAQRSVAELELIVKKLTKEVKILKKYSSRLEQEISKFKIEGLDFEAIRRQVFEEAATGSQKIPTDAPTTPMNSAKSGIDNDEDSENAEMDTDKYSDDGQTAHTLNEISQHLDGTISLPSSPKSGGMMNGFGRAMLRTGDAASPSMVRSSSTLSQLRSRGTPTRLSSKDDIDLISSPMSTNTTPTRPTIYLDGILNDDESDAMLDAQLEYNRMKENLNLQIQDLTEELSQASEEKDTMQQQHRMQLAKAVEDNTALKSEIEALKQQISQMSIQQHAIKAPEINVTAKDDTLNGSALLNGTSTSSSPLPSMTPLPAKSSPTSPTQPIAQQEGKVPSLKIGDRRSSSPTPPMRRGSVSQSPRAPITIPLDGTSPLRREASDPVFMARQMFHWMVLATKLEMFSQGQSMRYDLDFESIFRELVESNASTQAWPKKIMKALETPPTPRTPNSASSSQPKSSVELSTLR